MSDVYAGAGNQASQAKLLNRTSDLSLVTDANVAPDAAIAHSKMRRYIGEIAMDPAAAARYTIIVRHNLGVIPEFVTITSLMGFGAWSVRVAATTDKAVYLEYSPTASGAVETALVKVEA